MSFVYLPQTNNKRNPWQSGLCGCFEDFGICIKGYFCLPCLVAENSSKMDGDSPCCGCCYPANPFKNRYQAMGILGIQSTTGDCCSALCFPCCSEMQIARELKRVQDSQNANPSLLLLPGVGGSQIYMPRLGAPRLNTWKSGLCDCFSNLGICCRGYFCLCCLAADNSSKMDADRCCIPCLYPAGKNRAQAMALLGIPNTCGECMTAAFCPCCSEMQIARELEHLAQQQIAGGSSGGPVPQTMAGSNYGGQ